MFGRRVGRQSEGLRFGQLEESCSLPAHSTRRSAVSTGESTSFEDGLGGWAISGPPPGSGPNANNFIRTSSEGFPEGAAITTPDSIYLGFGLEGVATASSRATIMGAALRHLLR